MFKLLISINGVGAKAALSLLSISRINNLKYAILSGDEKHICRAPGIGKKTAGRIILELKDKIKKEDMVVEKDITVSNIEDDKDNYASNVAEAISALLSLGYTEKETELAIKNVNKEETVENIVKECLKNLLS